MGRFGQSTSLITFFMAQLALQGPAAGQTISPAFELIEPEDAGNHNWACRGHTPFDNSVSYYELHLGVLSLADCQALCVAVSPRCVGIEYSRSNNGRCEVWTRPSGIEAVGIPKIPGDFTCLRYGWPVDSLLAPADGGNDRVCRGESSSDKQPDYFLLGSSETLEGCTGRCSAARVCYGVSYHFASGRCELWTRPVKATAPFPGFICLRFEGALALPQTTSPPTDAPTTAAATEEPTTTTEEPWDDEEDTGTTTTRRTRRSTTGTSTTVTSTTVTTETTTVTETPCSFLGRDCGEVNQDWIVPGTCVLRAVTGGGDCNRFCGTFNMTCTHGGPALKRSCARKSGDDVVDSCSQDMLVQLCACQYDENHDAGRL